MLSIQIGDQTFVLSPTKGEWVSSHDRESAANESRAEVAASGATPSANAAAGLNTPGNLENERGRAFSVHLGPKHPAVIAIQKRIASFEERRKLAAEKKLGLALELPEFEQLTSKIANLEVQATELAGQIRAQQKPGQEQKNEPPGLLALRNELSLALAAAFDAKNDLEHLRIRKLQARLGLLEQEIGRRQAMRSQIIDRKGHELIDGEETNWNTDPSANTPNDRSAALSTPSTDRGLARRKNRWTKMPRVGPT